jgi:plasmid stabilization system protein ParE
VVVVWSLPARDDLKSIHAYIARDSKRYASRVAQDIRDKTKALLDLPYMGKVVPEISEPSLREISLYSYCILYEVMDETIYIHGVIHMRRNFTADDLER